MTLMSHDWASGSNTKSPPRPFGLPRPAMPHKAHSRHPQRMSEHGDYHAVSHDVDNRE